MIETLCSPPLYCTHLLCWWLSNARHIKRNSGFQNIYEPIKLCKFPCIYGLFSREYKAYAKRAQSQKDDEFLIQTVHAGEVPTKRLFPNKVTEKGRGGSRFSTGFKWGRVSSAEANRNGVSGMVGGWARDQNWWSINARKTLEHSGGHSGKVEIHHRGLHIIHIPHCPRPRDLTSFSISLSSIEWWSIPSTSQVVMKYWAEQLAHSNGQYHLCYH